MLFLEAGTPSHVDEAADIELHQWSREGQALVALCWATKEPVIAHPPKLPLAGFDVGKTGVFQCPTKKEDASAEPPQEDPAC